MVTLFTENSISVILKQAKPLLASQIKTRLKSFLVSKATQKHFFIFYNNVNQISLNCQPYWPEHEIGNTNIKHFLKAGCIGIFAAKKEKTSSSEN